MNTKYKVLSLSLLMLLSTTIFADSCQVAGRQDGTVYYGKVDCNNVSLSALDVKGAFTGNNVTVNGTMVVDGRVDAVKLKISNGLIVKGKATLNQADIKEAGIDGRMEVSSSQFNTLGAKGTLIASGSKFGEVAVLGNANIRDSEISGKLTLRGSDTLAVLNGVTVQNIIVQPAKAKKKPQILCLEKASLVKGDVNFAAGNGQIYTMGASKIQGKIIGAKVIEGQCPDQGEVTIQ